MITEAIIKRLEAAEREIVLLKSQMRNINKKEQPSHDDILKSICDKIPKSNNKQLSNNDVIDLINKTITLKFVNKLYGKNNG